MSLVYATPAAEAVPTSHETTLRRLMIWVALYAVSAAVMASPVRDADLGWHLRTGEWVIAHGTVPTTDPFSTYGEGRPWVAYSWLFEVLAYGLYRALGFTGILLLRVVVALAALATVHRLIARREPRFVVATALAALAFVTLWPLMTERPWLFTVLFSVLTLDAVLALRAGSAARSVWLLPVLYALWANLHIQFIYGLAFLGLACVAPVFDRLLRRPTSGTHADTIGTPAWRRLVVLAAACALATLLNPYGARLYAVVWEYASQSAAYRIMHELQPLDFGDVHSWPVLVLFALAAFSLGRRPCLSSFDVLLLAGTAYASFHTRRDLWFVSLAALAILTTGPRRAVDPARRFVPPCWGLPFVASGVMAFFLAVTFHRGLSEAAHREAMAAEFPEGAVAFLKDHPQPGPLFNDMDWGGYLIWNLRELPVSIDGRTNLHGDDRLRHHVQTTAGIHPLEDSDLAAARLVIIRTDGPLPELLTGSGRFAIVYQDGLATVLTARTGPVSKVHASLEAP
jgi:hypothetical protein